MPVRLGIVRHVWIGSDGGEEYRCANCGQTVWLPDIPSRADATLEVAMRNTGILEDCDEEQVRQVMES